ncbi:unnamed protein product [Heligmosomoides polygyrus]|uniref:Uncharacterized protein n=1 Tax=Heligmosomoides polygyrus TaxID=6339 RepID=A0A3P8FKG2_HELPZ|nr:unnamed protein product [Heligmosomoides polygyrus]
MAGHRKSLYGIRDKHTLVCDRASPRKFVGARLVEVPLQQLDCSVNLFAMNSHRRQFLTALLTVIITFFFNQ